MPDGWQEAAFQDLFWLVRGQETQSDQKVGFSMQLYVDQGQHLVCQIGLVDLTPSERSVAWQEPGQFLTTAFERYFLSLKGAQRIREQDISQPFAGREYLWTMVRSGSRIQGRTRIMIRPGSAQAVYHAIMYEAGKERTLPIEAFFAALRPAK